MPVALLDEIAARLKTQGVGTTASTASWFVAKGFLPPTPDRVIALFETGGFPNDPHESALIDRPTFQVRVRGNAYGYSTARTKIGAARTALEVGNSTLSGRRYIHIVAQSEPVSLGQDENNRPSLVVNFTALRSRTS